MEAIPPGEWPPDPEWLDATGYDLRPTTLEPVRWRVLGALLTASWAVPLTALMLIAIGMLIAKVVFGLTPLSVRSGSMEPTIPTYSLAFVESVPSSQVHKGDVITFDPPGPHDRVTHRVVKTYMLNKRRHFETRGDANPNVDDWRSSAGKTGRAGKAGAIVKQSRGISYGGDDAVRYVFHVPWLGHLGLWLERPGVRSKAMYVPFILASLWMLGMIWARPFSGNQEQGVEHYQSDAWLPLDELPTFGTTGGDYQHGGSNVLHLPGADERRPPAPAVDDDAAWLRPAA